MLRTQKETIILVREGHGQALRVLARDEGPLYLLILMAASGCPIWAVWFLDSGIGTGTLRKIQELPLQTGCFVLERVPGKRSETTPLPLRTQW